MRKPWIKNILLLVWTMVILSTAFSSHWIISGDFIKGFSLLATSSIVGFLSLYIADLWHQRGVHATRLGFITACLFFLGGLTYLWWFVEISIIAPIGLFIAYFVLAKNIDQDTQL